MLRRIRWGAIASALLMVAAIGFTYREENAMGLVLALCAVAMAVLSLKERT